MMGSTITTIYCGKNSQASLASLASQISHVKLMTGLLDYTIRLASDRRDCDSCIAISIINDSLAALGT